MAHRACKIKITALFPRCMRYYAWALLLLLASCSSKHPCDWDCENMVSYIAAPALPSEECHLTNSQTDLFNCHSPIFVIEGADKSYNRIGKPSLTGNAKGECVAYVDPVEPVAYVQRRAFATKRGTYTNLIYRVHFEKVPFFHIDAGKNVGILVVITLNRACQPVLITTVHTDGRHVAFVPTSYLPECHYPKHWCVEGQTVWGENLPGLLEICCGENYHPVIYLRDGSHRVSDIRWQSEEEVAGQYCKMYVDLAPMDNLKCLPMGECSTSFYYPGKWYQGHVKDSHKPIAFLLMSWWTLDSLVGVDKEYGPYKETGTHFYTSLKFWDREKSDMWNYASFLRFWGWCL